MLKERTVSRIFGALLGVLSAFGGMGALATGMRFVEISLWTVLLVCVAGSVLVAAMAGRKLFAAVPVAFLAGCVWLWYRGALEPAAEAFLTQISTLYDMGYGWGVIHWMEEAPEPQAATLMFCLLGFLVSMAVTWSVVQGKSGWLAIPMVFLPLVPCLVLTDTVPETQYVFLQLMSILLILLSHGVRKRSVHQGNKLLGLLLIPVTAVLVLLFFLMPRENYQGQKYAQALENMVLELLQINVQEEQPSGNGGGIGFALDSAGRIQLTDVGPKVTMRIPVMTVTAEETTLMYLRGTAYDTYLLNHWDEDVIEGRITGTGSFYNNGEETKTVTISSRTVRDFLYFPYSPQSILIDGKMQEPTVKGRVKNEAKAREYTVRYSPVTDTSGVVGSAYYDMPILSVQNGQMVQIGTERVLYHHLERYLQLPYATRLAARELLARELPQLENMTNDWEKAKLIADFVRNSATYDLQTEKMPDAGKDFALWFLEESDTGYCTHFATATAVLLRAADVPCRYVTGYLARTQAGEKVTVLQRNAHAWVEVLVYGEGWLVLESTPGGGVEDTARANVVQELETDPEEPTNSEEPTDPEDPTKPEVSEEPTEPTPPEPGNHGETNPSQENDPENTESTFVLPGWAKGILWALLVILAVAGQWKLRVFLRMRRYDRGGNNARVLAMWQDVEKYARLLGTTPGAEYLELARKARFSQHRLSKEEVAAMTFGLKDLRRTLWRENRWKRLYARLILALY